MFQIGQDWGSFHPFLYKSDVILIQGKVGIRDGIPVQLLLKSRIPHMPARAIDNMVGSEEIPAAYGKRLLKGGKGVKRDKYFFRMHGEVIENDFAFPLLFSECPFNDAPKNFPLTIQEQSCNDEHGQEYAHFPRDFFPLYIIIQGDGH